MSAASLESGRHRWVDMAAVVVLGVLSLVPLVTTFAGWLWVLVALAGMAFGIGAMALLVERRGGLVAIPLVLAVGYVLLALPITSRRGGLAAWIPASDSVGLVMRGTAEAWGELVATFPLVDSSGAPLLVPLVLGLFPAAIASSLALGTRSTMAPALPQLVALVAAFVLGRGDLVQWPIGMAYGALALIWAARRGARLDDQRTPVTGRRVLAMAAMLAVATLLGSLISASATAEMTPTVLRESVARGMDTTTVASPLTGFRRYTAPAPGAIDNVHERKLLTVTGDGSSGLRMRFAVLDWYDGTQWRANPDSAPSASRARFLRVGTTLDNPATGPRVAVRVDVHRAWRSSWVPTAGALQEVGFDFHRGRVDRRTELRYNAATGALLLPTWLRARDDYWFSARLRPDNLDPGQGVGEALDPDVYDRAAFADEVARRFLARYPDRLEALLAAATQLRRKGRYSDGAEGWQTRFTDGHDVERLGELFLFAKQAVGNDEQYAAATALIATRMRIPARVVVGAVVPASGVIRGRNVHAWVEVQVADGSWRTLPTSEFMGTKTPDRSARDRRRKATVPVIVPQARGDRRVRTEERPPAQRPTAKPKPEPEPPVIVPQRDGWWLLLVLLGAVPAAKLVRRNRRRTAAAVPDRISGGWEEFLDTGRDLGHPVTRRQTRPVQAGELGEGNALAVLADDQVFGVEEPTEADAEAYWLDVMTARRDLLARAPRWKRLLIWFNPTSLIRRR